MRDGQEHPLPPKIFDILLLLVQNHGHLLEKEKMINAICFGVQDSISERIAMSLAAKLDSEKKSCASVAVSVKQ